MSIETWKMEFYPVLATKRMSKINAIRHRLRKWEGLRPENLHKHGISAYVMSTIIQDSAGSTFVVDSSSCALCVKYADSGEFICEECPLFLTLGNRCDGSDLVRGSYTIDERFPWLMWFDQLDPEPMIASLQKSIDGD